MYSGQWATLAGVALCWKGMQIPQNKRASPVTLAETLDLADACTFCWPCVCGAVSSISAVFVSVGPVWLWLCPVQFCRRSNNISAEDYIV